MYIHTSIYVCVYMYMNIFICMFFDIDVEHLTVVYYVLVAEFVITKVTTT